MDIEIPYSKIVDKWERKYKPRLGQHIENGRLQKRVLSIYYKCLGETDFPHDRAEAVQELEEINKRWAVNLCCQFEFSTGVSRDVIVEFAKKAENDIIDIGLEAELNENIGNGDSNPNKDGLTALCQLANPDILREILIYSRVTNRYPKSVYKRDSGGVPSDNDWDELIRNLSQNNVENYGIWYQFEHDGGRFVAIEQEDRDGVERQVGGNIEQEPANLIILHFDGNYLDVYTDTRGTANHTQTGVNMDLSGDSYEEDRNPIDPNEMGEFASNISQKDKERQEDNNVKLDYVLTDLHVSRTNFENNPEIKISAEGGVGKAVDELADIGHDILSDPRNIERLKIRYEGYKFTVTNSKRRTGSGDTYRELVYGCHADTSTREEFETLMDKEFQINLKYQSSS